MTSLVHNIVGAVGRPGRLPFVRRINVARAAHIVVVLERRALSPRERTIAVGSRGTGMALFTLRCRRGPARGETPLNPEFAATHRWRELNSNFRFRAR